MVRSRRFQMPRCWRESLSARSHAVSKRARNVGESCCGQHLTGPSRHRWPRKQHLLRKRLPPKLKRHPKFRKCSLHLRLHRMWLQRPSCKTLRPPLRWNRLSLRKIPLHRRLRRKIAARMHGKMLRLTTFLSKPPVSSRWPHSPCATRLCRIPTLKASRPSCSASAML